MRRSVGFDSRASGLPLNAIELTCLPNYQLRAQGATILRVVNELEDWLKDEEVPESLRADLRKMKETGEWLARSTYVDLKSLRLSGIPAAGYSPSGVTVA